MIKTLKINEIRNIQLEILSTFAELCNNNNLKYFLVYGTLLGAIRHKGYIPWDDDIDVAMPRKDYEKFVSCISERLPEHLTVMKPLESNSISSFIKIYNNKTKLKEYKNREKNVYVQSGVYIDVFCLDGLPENDRCIQKIYKKARFLYSRDYILRLCTLYKDIDFSFNLKDNTKKIIGILSHNFYKGKYFHKLNNLARSYDYDKADRVGTLMAGYWEKEINKRSVFDQTIKLEFEGKQYFAPAGYHDYLTGIYGDYMEYPPVSKRISPHDYDAFLID